MTRAEAMKKGQKLYGKDFCYRVGKAVSSPEDRDAVTSRRVAIREEREAISQEIERRMNELPWYVELTERRKALWREAQGLGTFDYHKFSVGRVEMGMFFIKGEGDTWEEAFAAAAERCKKSA